MGAPTIVETQNLTKHYRGLTALKELNLTIEQGAIFGFIGPNGAGKTTTMRILATLLTPSAGEARVCGYSTGREPGGVRRSLGYMPDSFGVYDDMKVGEYLDFFAACYQVPSARRPGMIGDLLELVDLAGKREAYVQSLSRGMQQRLCLARTLVHDPPLLILDEPASGLDPRARIELRELLKELRALGKTILLSSHILTEMAEICTHVGIIERGELLASGRVDEVLRRRQGQRTLVVRALAEPATALAVAQGLPGVINATLPETSSPAVVEPAAVTLQLAIDGDEASLAAVLAGLVAGGVGVYHFAEQQSNLEDIFMRVTTGAVQ